jgi:hypothetical protein
MTTIPGVSDIVAAASMLQAAFDNSSVDFGSERRRFERSRRPGSEVRSSMAGSLWVAYVPTFVPPRRDHP